MRITQTGVWSDRACPKGQVLEAAGLEFRLYSIAWRGSGGACRPVSEGIPSAAAKSLRQAENFPERGDVCAVRCSYLLPL